MWMRVCVGKRGRIGEDEEDGTDEGQMLLCLGWRSLNICVLRVGKVEGLSQVQA